MADDTPQISPYLYPEGHQWHFATPPAA